MNQEQTASRGRRDRAPVSPPREGLTPVLARNIQSLQERRAREEACASASERLAQIIGDFAGSMVSVVVHIVVFGAWIIANLGVIPGIPVWDPQFVSLAMVASVEAIFLSTFVLITQNRMAALAEKRADLDLQISLLAEHEVTRLMTMVSAIADKVGAQTDVDQEIEELEQDVAPEVVLDKLDEC